VTVFVIFKITFNNLTCYYVYNNHTHRAMEIAVLILMIAVEFYFRLYILWCLTLAIF